MIALTKRNLLVFFRDRTSVFFSLLSVFIIIGLYVLFFGDVMLSGWDGVPSARFLMNSWIMAGLLAVTSVSTTMGAFGTMVEDRGRNILKDFSASPLSRAALTGGYITSSYIVGVIMSVLALVFAEVYIAAYGGALLSVFALLKVLGLILLTVFASNSVVFLLVSFLGSLNAFSAASAIVGTLVGFLTGIYIPIGNLPAAMQLVIKCFPISHAGALFRQVMMEAPLSAAFAGAPPAARDAFAADLGVYFSFGSHQMTWLEHVAVLLVTGCVFYLLSLVNVSRKSK